LFVEKIELEKKVGGGGSVWGRSGRVTVERNEGEVFFWRVTVQQSESTVFWVTWVWWPGCVAEKVGHHSIEGTKRKRKRML